MDIQSSTSTSIEGIDVNARTHVRKMENSQLYPSASKPLSIRALAELRMRSSSIPHPNRFHVFHPICGVRAKPLLRAITAGRAERKERRARAMSRAGAALGSLEM